MPALKTCNGCLQDGTVNSQTLILLQDISAPEAVIFITAPAQLYFHHGNSCRINHLAIH